MRPVRRASRLRRAAAGGRLRILMARAGLGERRFEPEGEVGEGAGFARFARALAERGVDREGDIHARGRAGGERHGLGRGHAPAGIFRRGDRRGARGRARRTAGGARRDADLERRCARERGIRGCDVDEGDRERRGVAGTIAHPHRFARAVARHHPAEIREEPRARPGGEVLAVGRDEERIRGR